MYFVYRSDMKTSAPLGARKCNFPAFFMEIMTEQSTNGHEDSKGSYTYTKRWCNNVDSVLKVNTVFTCLKPFKIYIDLFHLL